MRWVQKLTILAQLFKIINGLQWLQFVRMRYALAAALLSLSGGNSSRESIIALLQSAGIRFQQAKLDSFLQAIGQNQLHYLISKGLQKIALQKAAQEQQKRLKNIEQLKILHKKMSKCGSQDQGGGIFDDFDF